MNNERVEWYHSTSMLFLVAAICISTMALFSMFDDWFGIGKDLSGMIFYFGALCALNSAIYHSIQRGKYGAFLSAKLNHIYFWLMLAPLVLLLYYGMLTRNVVRANYANYPLLRGRMHGAIQLAEVALILGGLVFVSNMVRAAWREKRSRS